MSGTAQPGPALFLAGSPAAARQWEIHLALPQMRGGRAVLDGGQVETVASFAARAHLAYRSADTPVLIGPRQSAALWRRIVEESDDGGSLLDGRTAARWARDAWNGIHGWHLADRLDTPGRLRLAELDAYLRWARRYRRTLAERRWLDAAGLDAWLSEAFRTARAAPRGVQNTTAGTLWLADCDPAPATAAWLEQAGGAVRPAPEGERLEPRLEQSPAQGRAQGPAQGRAFQAIDPDDEVQRAAEWAAEWLHRQPDARVAVVIADVGTRIATVRRMFRSTLPPAAALLIDAEDPHAVDARAWLGAALTTVDLLGPAGDFGTFSRWLRSPFYLRDERERRAAATFEVEWRGEPAAQLPFLDAYLHAGLRPKLLLRWPEAARRLDAALDAIGEPGRARLPGEWAQAWSRALGAMDWQGDSGDEAADDAAHLERALHDLAALSAITGPIGPRRAREELDQGLSAALRAHPWPLSGVVVLTHLRDVGPGYDAIWVTGATEDAFPYPVRLNPLLPAALQRDAGLPWSTPADAYRRTRQLFDRVRRRGAEVVFSWPGRVQDEPSAPCSWLRALTQTGAVHGALKRGREEDRHRSSAAQEGGPGDARRIEIIDDEAPPLDDRHITGGTAALDAQAESPLRAFCRYRLGARPLPGVQRGVSRAVQGRIVHGALERFFRRFPSSDALAAVANDDLVAEARAAARAATTEALGVLRGPLAPFVELEVERARRVLERLIPAELERAPYRVVALEQAATLALAGHTLALRVDRIDELEGGGLAILDYKSGGAPRIADWFRPRPGQLQLPLYALVAGQRVDALGVVMVQPASIGYVGIWSADDAFPGRARRDPAGRSLVELMAHWRDAVEQLVTEYSRGDTRCFIADTRPAAGPYAALTRIHEQIELHALTPAGEGE